MAKIISYTKAFPCIIGLLLLSFSSFIASGQDKDIVWLRDIYHNRNESLGGTMKFLSDSYIPINVAVPIGQLIYGYAKHDKKTIRYGWETAGGLVIATVLTQGSKYVINRPRPYVSHPDIVPYTIEKDASMPSGHTSFCFSTATSLSLEYPKWYIIAPSFLYACVVSYSRMYLGEHYPSDVFVGALVGAGSSYLSYQGMKWLQHRKHKKQNTAEAK